MYEVTIRKSFSAAHLLKEIGGKCEELHGHNFIVEVSAAAETLDEEGLLKRWTDEVLDGLDHKYLNELECFKGINPSSERIARFLFERIDEKAGPAKVPLTRVTVWESENARVSYSR
jgi:6-pyruvoyltetrahydropterin/6-carboxytetrahydropterin synthase